jgi:hypothetical protein
VFRQTARLVDMMKHTLGVLLLVPVLTAGCAVESDDEVDTTEVDQDIVGGMPTATHPEIGRVFPSGCTATLISPRVVLTASHCLSPSYSATTPAPGSLFWFTDASGTPSEVSVDKVVSFNPQGDVALMHLTAAVPASQALPATISAYVPSNAQIATYFGFGCNSVTGTGYGVKRYYTFAFGAHTSVLCPGDSGGPAVFGTAYSTGPIWGVITQGPSPDGIALVTSLKTQIEAEIRAWDGSLAEQNLDRPGMDFSSFSAPSAASCSVTCDRDACRAWSWVESTTTCYLKSGAPDPFPAAGVTSGLARSQEVGNDRAGGDYEMHSSVASADECQQLCSVDYHYCRSWTWVQSSQSCWLKHAVQTSYAHAGCVSGVRDKEYEDGFDRPGGDLRQLATPTANDCGWTCAKDSACKAFVWSATYKAPGTQNNCWLKNTVYPAVPSSRFTTGVRRGMKIDALRDGTLLRSFTVMTPLWPQIATPSPSSANAFVCQSACTNEIECMAWNFVLADGYGGRCELMSDVLGSHPRPRAITGVKTLEFTL